VSERITLRGIRAYGKHGANPGERDHVQPLDVDLELDFDASAARASDVLADTIDYAQLHALVTRLIRQRSYQLLERLGDELLHEIMRDERVLGARVTIGKPGLLAGATPSVTLSTVRVRQG